MCSVTVCARVGPKQLAQLQEIYESARMVTATFPDTHVACIAAKKLIAAFNEIGWSRIAERANGAALLSSSAWRLTR